MRVKCRKCGRFMKPDKGSFCPECKRIFRKTRSVSDTEINTMLNNIFKEDNNEN